MPDVPASAILTATLPGINQEWTDLCEFGAALFWKKGSYYNPYVGEKSFYFIEAGSLIILHGAANGQVRNMICMRAGSLINLAHVLGSSLTTFMDDGCRFYCLTDVKVRKFSGKILEDEQFVREHPGLIINLMQSLGVRLLLMHNTIANSVSGDAVARLARFCLNMSLASNDKLDISIDIPLTDLANLLGMHRISLFRASKKLKKLGAISSIDRERIIISDLDVLKKLVIN